jgi:hypothetical protein
MAGTVSSSANANFSSVDGNEYYVGPGTEAPIPPRDPEGNSTIVCDGQGGYAPQLNGWSDYPCGIVDCVTTHEESHASDWAARFPDGCDGQPEGARVPTGGDGYSEFRADSECDAYRREAECEQRLLANADPECEAMVGRMLSHSLRLEQQTCGEQQAPDEC